MLYVRFSLSLRNVEDLLHERGIAGSPSKFGGSLGTAAGASNLGIIWPEAFWADTPVVLIANGGDFTGGAVRVAIHALAFAVPG